MLGIAVINLSSVYIYQLAIYRSNLNYHLSNILSIYLSLYLSLLSFLLDLKQLKVHSVVLKTDVLDSRVELRSEGGAETGLWPEVGVQSGCLEAVALAYSPR